jgi:Flp pilus assembly protein TadG
MEAGMQQRSHDHLPSCDRRRDSGRGDALPVRRGHARTPICGGSAVTQGTSQHVSGSERGQTLALMILFLMSLLGMSALAIDAGTWYQERRQVQGDADAAALAGAAYIPANTAISGATANFNKNKMAGETITVTMPSADTVHVVITYPAATYFARLFGKTEVTVGASATAQIQAAGAVKHHISPYAVTEASYNNGIGTTLFNCDASGQCGTIDLPTADNTSGGSCSGNVYTGVSSNVQAAITDQIDIGQVEVGGCLSPKTGNAQPSGNAVNNLPGSISQDLQDVGNGQYQVIPQSWDDAQKLPPRLIYVPIVPSFATGTNANMTVSAFAWFYITGATGSGQGLKINGKYVSLAAPPSSGSTVAWVPGRIGQVTSVALTE